ncbi:hypothetical protein, partial [Desulfovibrio sp. ZJ369]|uniref:hypothetical protein n=1 Tax=Desulfovibrio sp. ZJ369 TaxID=2709793 RepID=UPI00197CF907
IAWLLLFHQDTHEQPWFGFLQMQISSLQSKRFLNKIKVKMLYGVVTHQSGGPGQLQGDSIRNITGRFGGHALGWYGGFGSGPFYSYSSGDRGSAGNGIGTSWGFDVSRAHPQPRKSVR